MAVSTTNFCFHCKSTIYTINNNMTGHWKVCHSNPNNFHNIKSSVSIEELKWLAEMTKNWKLNENKKDCSDKLAEP